jgi:hypothetical protein
MGNFYANHVVRSDDPDRIVRILEELGRRAYVASSGHVTFVYDERCDAQDPAELRDLATRLSRECRVPVLAVCNHDDDVLTLALGEEGKVVEAYNSFPGYFEDGGDEPLLANIERLCAAFGGSEDRRADVEALLRRPHGDIHFEVERHIALFTLLGLPTALAPFGFQYAAEGELAGADRSATLRATRNVELSDDDDGAPAPPNAMLAAGIQSNPQLVAMGEAMLALALSEIETPATLRAAIGDGRANGLVLYMRIMRYITTHRLIEVVPGDSRSPLIRPDPLLAGVVGEDAFPFAGLAQRIVDALGLMSGLTEAERQAMRAGDRSIQARAAAALQDAMAVMAKERLT